jgi:hypothetical protein
VASPCRALPPDAGGFAVGDRDARGASFTGWNRSNRDIPSLQSQGALSY